MSYITEFSNRSGFKYTAEIARPENPKGTAVIHHGYPGSRQSPTVRKLSEVFYALGLTTVMPNTTYNYSDSYGDYREHSLQGHCDDLEDCIRTVVESDAFTAPLVIAGHSAGGYSALNVSSRLTRSPYMPKLTVASAPLTVGAKFADRMIDTFADIHGVTFDSFKEKWRTEGLIRCNSDSGSALLDLRWSVMKEWSEHDLTYSGTRPKNLTLLVGGANDAFMPPADIQEYADIVGIKEVRIIDQADHAYQGREDAFENAVSSVAKRVLEL